jgi:type I restriction enzyme S subunit
VSLSFLGATLPSNWSEATIRDVTSKVGSGSTPRGGSAVYVENGPALIRSQNVYEHFFSRKGLARLTPEAADRLLGATVEPDDVLLNITGGSILRTTVVPTDVLPARVSQHVAIVRANGKVDPHFLQKWLSLASMKEYMLGYSSGRTRKAITKEQILSFPVPLPPLAEQRAIASIFGALESKIEADRNAVRIALELLDALSVKQSRSSPRTPLGSIVSFAGTTVKPETYGDRLVAHYSIPAFDADARPERVTASTLLSNKILLDGPGILVSRLNPRLDRMWWVAPSPTEPAVASPEFFMLQTSGRRFLAGVWLALRDAAVRRDVTRRATGTSDSRQRIRPDDLLAIEVPDIRLASETLLDGALVLLERIESYRSEINALTDVRDALLPELLSGRIRVPVQEPARLH